jgi:glycerol dehydrogenase
MNVPVIIAPTIASTDAPCSSLAIIYRPDTGRIKRVLMLRRNPDVVLVDTKIIANSPERFLVAGMGDALATWFEAESCRLKHAKNMVRAHSSMTAQTLARLCYETLMEYGVAAKIACRQHVVIPALEHVVEANTLLSGVGFESVGLAAAHAIQDGFNALDKDHKYYHGEKVAFGALVSLFLTDKSSDMIDEVYSFCESVGLPTTLAALGLNGLSDLEIGKVASIACAEKETIHNELIPVTPETVIAAIKVADEEGKLRKNKSK